MKNGFHLSNFFRTMPDHFIRPTGHDLAFRKYVLESDPSLRLLNLGSGKQRPVERPNVINIEISPSRCVHVLGDAHALPFKGASFDGVICRAVLEHLRYPSQACHEIFRVLVDDGFVLVTAPFIYPYHAHPHDYQRLTASGLQVLFEDFDEVECGIGRFPTAALLSVLETYASIFSDNRAVSGLLRWSIAWALNPLKCLDYYLKGKKRVGLLSSYYYLGRKPACRREVRSARREQERGERRWAAIKS